MKKNEVLRDWRVESGYLRNMKGYGGIGMIDEEKPWVREGKRWNGSIEDLKEKNAMRDGNG